MSDVQIRQLAAEQFNRVSRRQLLAAGLSSRAIEHRVADGELVIVEQAVYGFAPVLDDDWGRWMGATLTAPDTYLSHVSAAAAWGFWGVERYYEIVTRPGNGGRKRHGGVLVFRSTTLDGDVEIHHGVRITSVVRTLIDLAAHVSDRALARAVREAIRLELTTLAAIGDGLGRHRGRRGTGKLAKTAARYSGLPLERARSGAEVHAMEVLRDAGGDLPKLNEKVAGVEADLVWQRERLIIEIDGGPFHRDKGEDARKEAIWRAAGWAVRRLAADDVEAHPERLLERAP